MGQEKPVFKGGNLSIAAALNRLANALWKHGVNPAGVPGWSETADGWMPPIGMGGSSSVSRLDLVPGNADGTKKLRAPLIVAGINDLHESLVVTNNDITLAADKWVVLKVDNVSPGEDPYSFTLDVVDAETDESLKSYTFDPTSDELTQASLPIYRLTDTAVDSFSIAFGEDLFATRVMNGEVLVLASRFVVVPDKPLGRFVPTLMPV